MPSLETVWSRKGIEEYLNPSSGPRTPLKDFLRALKKSQPKPEAPPLDDE
jgi:hypothetical protein